MNKIAVVDKAHNLREELIHITKSATEQFFRLGEIMKEVRDKEYWKALGYESFASFYADPEISYAKSTVYHSIKLAETFPDWRNRLEQIPVGKLIQVAPQVTDENREEILTLAETLSRSDLEKELSGEVVAQDVSGSDVPMPKVSQCDMCHKVKGIKFEDLCHCGWEKKNVLLISEAISRVSMENDYDDEWEDGYEY